MSRLTALKVRSAKPGKHCDTAGLFLYVKPSGSKSWVLRLQSSGRRRDYGLGSARDISLAEAREKAAEMRKLVRSGVDPIEIKRGAAAERARQTTFEYAARKYYEEQKDSWRSDKHRAQWLSSLESYAFGHIGDVPVNEVSAPAVRDALLGIWLTKPETARRVKQRIGAVLDWAHAAGIRDSEAPQRAIGKGLPRQPRKERHFAALPYAQLPALYSKLTKSGGVGALALRFTILTAARSGEVRGAVWDELDLDARTWAIPASRMKAGREHIVPLSDEAVAILKIAEKLPRKNGSGIIFPGLRGGPVSDMTLTKALRTAGEAGATVHGCRSSFRDFVAEQTSFSGEVAEAALAHVNPNRVEAAYRRTLFIEKRTALMSAWAAFVCS